MNGNRGNNDKNAVAMLKAEVKSKHHLSKIEIERLIEIADILANELQRVKTHQLRRFFNVVKSVDTGLRNNKEEDLATGQLPEENWVKLQMMRPQMANAANRNKREMEKLMAVTEQLLIGIEKRSGKDFSRMMNFYESLVAYHRQYARD